VVVGACSEVDDKNLTIRINELFWIFTGRKTDIKRATIWGLFPWVGGYAYDLSFREIRAYGPRVQHCIQFCWKIDETEIIDILLILDVMPRSFSNTISIRIEDGVLCIYKVRNHVRLR